MLAIWAAPPVEPVKFVNYFLVGFLHGMLTLFTTILSLINPKVTSAPTYITDTKYWVGYCIGVLAFASVIGYQMRKMYEWRRKNDGGE